MGDSNPVGTVLVTGCAGFIGSRVCERLLAAGGRVVGLDNLRAGPDWELKRWRLAQLEHNPGFCLLQIDIRDSAALQQAPQQLDGPIDALIHLAALTGVRQSTREPDLCTETNVLGTLNVLELCRQARIPKFVFSSSSSVYGASHVVPYNEEQITDTPLSPYAASKKAGELLCHVYHTLYGIDVTAFRYFTVYGPAGRPDMLPLRLVHWISEGLPVMINGDGSQRRDFTYVDDIVQGIVGSLGLPGYQIINLGSDHPVGVLEAVRVVEKLTGCRATLTHRDANPSDPECTWADIDRASTLLGWQPRTGFEEGMGRLVKWYQDNRTWARDIPMLVGS